MKKIITYFWNFLHSTTLKTYLLKTVITLSVFIPCLYYDVNTWPLTSIMIVFMIAEFSTTSVFWLMLSGIQRQFNSNTELMTLFYLFLIILAIKFIFKLMKKEINYKSKIFTINVILFIIFSVIVITPLSLTYSFLSASNMVLFILLFLLLFCLKKDIDISSLLFNFFIYVITVSLFILIFENHFYFATAFSITFDEKQYYRFNAFMQNPNLTTAILHVALTAWFVLYKKEKLKKPIYFFGLFAILSFIFLTISKTSAFVLLFFFIFVIIENLAKTIKLKDKKMLLELVYYFISLASSCLICFNHVGALYTRIFLTENDVLYEPGLDNLTTGRVVMYDNYLKTVFSSPRTILFGHGHNSLVHNVFIDFLYRIGFIPSLLIASMFIVSIIPYIKKIKFYSICTFLIIFLTYNSIGTTSIKHLHLYIVAYLSLYFSSLNETNSTKKST